MAHEWQAVTHDGETYPVSEQMRGPVLAAMKKRTLIDFGTATVNGSDIRRVEKVRDSRMGPADGLSGVASRTEELTPRGEFWARCFVLNQDRYSGKTHYFPLAIEWSEGESGIRGWGPESADGLFAFMDSEPGLVAIHNRAENREAFVRRRLGDMDRVQTARFMVTDEGKAYAAYVRDNRLDAPVTGRTEKRPPRSERPGKGAVEYRKAVEEYRENGSKLTPDQEGRAGA